MRRRLTISILATVAVALVLAGVVTLVLARFGARRATEDELRSQAEVTAQLVQLGQDQIGQLNTVDTRTLRQLVCDRAAAGGTVMEQIRSTLCAPSTDEAVTAAVEQFCSGAGDEVTPALRDQVTRFCASPSATTLDELRGGYCQTVASRPPATGANRKRIETLRRNLCDLVSTRNENRAEVRSTLTRESIALVTFAPDGTVTSGQLPDGLTVAQVQPDVLRSGATVSGPNGGGLFAAAPVDAGAPSLSAVVIARPSDPSRGLLPWFLLASGLTLLVGLAIASSLARRLTRPLREATAATARIAEGDLAVRLPEHAARPGRPHDELDELAHAINSMAETLERSRGLERQFLLSVSHDLRTPLTSIRGYAEAIADGATDDAAGAAGVILAESRRLERLVQDLLDLAKLDARSFALHPVALDLVELCGDSVDGFRREGAAAGVTVRLDAPDHPVGATADPDRLAQVVANLVENALKFTTSRVDVRVVGPLPGPIEGAGTATIEVADDGPGIAAEDLPHVFERLYVAAARPRRKETGSGLGLAVARELVEAMGGRITVGAAPGGGASFLVTLPAARSDGTPVPADPTPGAGPAPTG